MPSLSYVVVDVFTDSVFSGSPLAVIMGNDEASTSSLSESDMQKIAREFNLSETVFVMPASSKKNDFRFKIFSPERQLPFSGHPTVGGVFVLASQAAAKKDLFRIEELAGVVPVEVSWENAAPSTVTLTSAQLPRVDESPISRRVAAALLNLDESQVLGDAWIVSCGLRVTLVEVRDIEALAAARFNYSYWTKKGREDDLGKLYCFTGDGAPSTALRARCFGPAVGLKEDPATGSAAVALGALLGQRQKDDGSFRWRVHQGIEMGRPAVLDIEASVLNGEVSETKVGGQAVLVGNGSIMVPSRPSHLTDVTTKN